ncbi:ARABIDOPSIS ENT-KAURENOIC ACID HYDROXYLASE 2, ent-kaurenoic acid hydroxylase 2 [Hibiscus trionum]|uniref:ARABIDOPSIS ENT-KAURENOIC ACID HYDROXYLASE 2, ent-kaurenoic acid hydroxylase 2 n=1 Tax=Hibiscus trionum TaxID=183268 RepID=A0A9W7MWK3_HIBTR|nr:ARABIDOPSIS ENT-KAURENOIC ACID HYDROXYLASE 2, ent-kaurenoic acid hydroxylase 2 [Hibiscus trionum]
MGLELLWSLVAVLAATYAISFGFLKKLNEWYYVRRLRKKKQDPPLPPGDMGWPFVGNMCSFLTAFKSQDPDSFIHNLNQRYGGTSIYKTHLFGSPSVIVCSPELCRKVLTDDEHFLFGYPSSAIQLGGKKSMYGVPMSEHRRLRRLTTDPINGHQALALYIGHIEHIVIPSLEDLSSMNKPIKFFSEMKRIGLKVIAQLFLGSTKDSDLFSMVKYYTELFPGVLSLPINIPGFAFHRAMKARRKLVKMIQDELDKRRATSLEEDRKKGMMDLLMEVESENGEKLEDEHIIDLLLLILFAGHETTAHTMMWVLIYLNQHPEMLQKAKEEQQTIIKRRPSAQKGLTLTEIKQMEYLPKVIDESLRRNNFAFALFRKVEADVNFNGYTIPKGWKVLVWYRALHMDPNIYSNPKEFIPSRWENHRFRGRTFIPFGAGSRTCPGADLAKLEISISLHYFLLNYKLEELNPKGPISYLPLPRPADDCLARIIKLPSSS